MDGAQVGVLKQTNKVRLGSLLEGKHSMALETQISLEVLCNFPNKPLEGQLPDQQLSALLVLADLTIKLYSRHSESIKQQDTRLDIKTFKDIILLTGGQQSQGGSGGASSLLQWSGLTCGQPMKQITKSFIKMRLQTNINAEQQESIYKEPYLSCKLLPGSLPSRGLASGLLGTCHLQ